MAGSVSSTCEDAAVVVILAAPFLEPRGLSGGRSTDPVRGAALARGRRAPRPRHPDRAGAAGVPVLLPPPHRRADLRRRPRGHGGGDPFGPRRPDRPRARGARRDRRPCLRARPRPSRHVPGARRDRPRRARRPPPPPDPSAPGLQGSRASPSRPPPRASASPSRWRRERGLAHRRARRHGGARSRPARPARRPRRRGRDRDAVVRRDGAGAADGAWRALNLFGGPAGRALRTLPIGEVAPATVGVDVGRLKLAAFVAPADCASVAGPLLAPMKGSIAPDVAGVARSVEGMTMTVPGALLGAAILTAPPQAPTAVQEVAPGARSSRSWADARHRPRADGPARAPAARRARHGGRADPRAADPGRGARAGAPRGHRAPGRAEGLRRARDRRPRPRHGDRARHPVGRSLRPDRRRAHPHGPSGRMGRAARPAKGPPLRPGARPSGSRRPPRSRPPRSRPPRSRPPRSRSSPSPPGSARPPPAAPRAAARPTAPAAGRWRSGRG